MIFRNNVTSSKLNKLFPTLWKIRKVAINDTLEY